MLRHRGLLGGGVLLGLLVLSAPGRTDEAAAVKAVEKLGGSVTVDAKRPGKPVVAVNLIATEITDAGMKELKELKSLQTLELHETKVTDAGMKELKELKSLQTLYLWGTDVTDAGMKELKELKSLQMLLLSNTKVTAEGRAELQKALPKLKIRD